MSAVQEHDEIQLEMASLYEGVFQKVDAFEFDWVVKDNEYSGPREVIERVNIYGDIVDWICEAASIPDPNVPSFRVVWEFPIPGKSEPVGYIDLLVEHLVYQVNVSHSWEHILGKGDPLCQDPEHWSSQVVQLRHKKVEAIEIKSYIDSIGETIRQVQKYKAALPWCNCPYHYGQKRHIQGCYSYSPVFQIVSPDDRFKDVITGQGIRFRSWGDADLAT